MKLSRSIFLPAILIFSSFAGFSQPQLPETAAALAEEIKKDVQNKDHSGAISALTRLQNEDGELFRLNNYGYLLARLSEKTGDHAGAITHYAAVINRNSVLSDYARWHLSQLMRTEGNMIVERLYLKQLIVLSDDSLLREAAQLRLAQSYFESKDFSAAIAVLKKVRFSAGDATFLSNITSVPGIPGIPADPKPGNLIGNDARTREALVLLGRAYRQNSQAVLAREIFNRLCDQIPTPAMPDDFALAAVRGLDELDGIKQNAGATSGAAELPETEHLKRAAIYQFNRDFTAARLHYNALIDRFPQSRVVPDAMYQIGRGLIQEGLFDEAIPWFERIQVEFPDHPISADALNQAAAAYARTKKTNEAVSRYQKYIATYPEGESFERAFLNIIDAWRDEAEFTRALEWTEKTQERFSGKTTGALAIFARAKIYITQNDWERARTSLEELSEQADLGGARVAGGTSRDEVAFLHAFALEKLGRFGGAIDEYLEIPDGRNEYYGWRATERLGALAKEPGAASIVTGKLAGFQKAANQAIEQHQPEAARKAAQSALRLTDDAAARTSLLNIARHAYSLLPGYNDLSQANKELKAGRREFVKESRGRPAEENLHRVLADELLFLGLYDEATPELEIALREKDLSSPPIKTMLTGSAPSGSLSDLPPDTAFMLADLYLKGGSPARATAYIEPLWKKIPDDYLCELAQREMLEMLYPAPFVDSLRAESAPRGLDPRFILSIMRQESRFRPDVKSKAAARGLMQFISSTSDKIAGELGKPDLQQNDLYYPPVAVLFGAQYLKDLFNEFSEQPQAVAASYNGGEINVARWLKRAHSNDPDRYVAELVFAQSKDYVYRVMTNYRIYKMLYDENLNSRSADGSSARSQSDLK